MRLNPRGKLHAGRGSYLVLEGQPDIRPGESDWAGQHDAVEGQRVKTGDEAVERAHRHHAELQADCEAVLDTVAPEDECKGLVVHERALCTCHGRQGRREEGHLILLHRRCQLRRLNRDGAVQ